MKILVYGAGVIGSVYAAYLHGGGHQVSVLARGRREAQLREHGILIEAVPSGKRMEAKVSTVSELGADDAYDLVLVAVQAGQLSSVLPFLAANRHTPTVAFLGNQVSGPSELTQAIGAERVLLGFPGFGGTFEGPVVHFASEDAAAERLGLTLGELHGRETQRLGVIREAFAAAAIDVALEPDMDAWLKGHVALVVPILFGLRRHGLDHEAVARDRGTLRLIARAIREGLNALSRLGTPITPFRLKTIRYLPTFVTAAILAKIIGSEFARVAFAGHAAHAADEFDLLRDEFLSLIAFSGLATPALDELCA